MDSGTRYCMGCGRSIDFGANVCPYCGHDFRAVPQAQGGEKYSPGIRAVLYVSSILVWLAGVIIGIVLITRDDPESKRVGKICLVLGVISVIVVVGMSAALYVMVRGLGDDGDSSATPTVALVRYNIGDDVKYMLTSPSSEMPWSDLSILLSDGTTTVSWSPVSSDMTGVVGETEEYAEKSLTSISVSLTITDLAGDGEVGMGDSILLSPVPSFNAAASYTLTLIWEPTGERVWTGTFSG